MTPLQLITLGLSRGTKIELSYKNWKNETITVNCFFGGYRNFMGQYRIDNEYDLVPIFYEEGKNGRMRNKRLEGAPYDPRYIIGIRVLEENTPFIWNESNDLYLAHRNLDFRARFLIENIVTEMLSLFPGKKILFGEYRCGGYISYKYGAGFADFKAIYLDSHDDLVVDFTTDSDQETSYPYDEVDIDSTVVLSCLCDAIKRPLFDEYEDKDTLKENFIDPETVSWKDIPNETKSEHPTIYRLQLLHMLKTNLWFKNLDKKKKKEYEEKKGKPWNEWPDTEKSMLYVCETNLD